ncbi:MAG: hypothetical protein QOE86_3138 [Solirubrobacteraceae bacterium]|nr:hypothetical protein [Solirubrobacteraceae bacterium]
MLRKLVFLAAFAVAFAGCGNKTELTTVADTEGIYVDVGGLTYQVQLSRFLNPGDVEDKQYLQGLPEGVPAQLPGDEIWFGVWMRVKNYSDPALTPTNDFVITDTEENEYRPVPLDSATNPFVYEPILLQHAQVLPTPDTAAASGPIQGSLILFRLKTDSLQNRPLTLAIEQNGAESGEVDLDL